MYQCGLALSRGGFEPHDMLVHGDVSCRLGYFSFGVSERLRLMSLCSVEEMLLYKCIVAQHCAVETGVRYYTNYLKSRIKCMIGRALGHHSGPNFTLHM